jgi:hypothetical protein
MENQKEGEETSGIGDTQNTGDENSTPVENKATENPASDSNALNNTVQETKVSEDAAAEVKPVSEGLPVRNIPLSSPSTDDAIEMVHKDAVKLESVKADVVFETVDSAGRGSGPRFIANTDPNRAVKTYLPKKGEFAILPIGRNSDKVSEGGVVGSTMVELGFSFRFFSAKHKLQVSLVLVNGKELIGYVLKGEAKGARRAFYFPKSEAEKVVDLPQRGKQTKLQVAKLLVG